jgi:hypothetical protein
MLSHWGLAVTRDLASIAPRGRRGPGKRPQKTPPGQISVSSRGKPSLLAAKRFGAEAP